MNIKYFYEFKGTDNILNRVEILCNETVTAKEITASKTPFIIEYPEVKKLEAVQASGATLELISKQIFQFTDLHTDNMQGYLLKFYRAGSLYWIGWLDSELYKENLSSFPPYPVTFSGSDFNVLERLKFRDATDSRYTDITPLLTQLKRCFDKLALPFNKLYIGCSTIPDGITLSVSETALHKLYIQSSNFYDEDGEPMTCREVVESILEPFGLMLVQRDASIYIYDYNTIKAGGVMKCYNFNTLAYVGDTATNTVLGDLPSIGFASADSSLGYEEMINNVEITSSMYATLPFAESEVNKENLQNKSGGIEDENYRATSYWNCKGWAYDKFTMFEDKKQDSTIMGARIRYSGLPDSVGSSYAPAPILEFNLNKDCVCSSPRGYMLNIKLDAYFNTKVNPFNDEDKTPDSVSQAIGEIACHLILTNEQGQPIKYYTDRDRTGTIIQPGWKDFIAEDEKIFNQYSKGGLKFVYTGKDMFKHRAVDNWQTSSNMITPAYVHDKIWSDAEDKNLGKGKNIILPDGVSGFIKLIVLDAVRLYRVFDAGVPGSTNKLTISVYPPALIKDVLINNFSATIVDKDGKEIKPIDYEFKSYVNKKVATDFEKKDLKVVSCNEDMLPVGKGNILKYVTDHYELQLSFTRAGQTDILERLLMCSIHSNFTTKNRVISVDIKMGDNPAMRTVTYNGIIDTPGMLVTGSVLDFSTAVTRITAVDFSGDTAKLSSIAYE